MNVIKQTKIGGTTISICDDGFTYIDFPQRSKRNFDRNKVREWIETNGRKGALV